MELVPERMVAGGDALAREESGRVVFVEGALPGERVRVRLTHQKRDYARAVVESVADASEHRVQPPCPFLAAGCGGCTWQHVEPAHQATLKGDIVREALRRTGGLADPDVVIGPVLTPWGFRTSLRLAVLAGRPAFRRHASHELVAVDACLVAHPRLDDLLATARFPGADQVTLRCSAATGERLALMEPATSRAVLPADVAVGPGSHVTETVAGARFRVSGPSFFQTRPDGAAALVAAVDRAVGPALAGASLADLYGGVGLFAATLGRAAADVTLVEVTPSSAADARVNLPGIVVHERSVEAWDPQRADVVVADPPRAGLGRGAAAVVAATGAAHVALVSCDAAALARDAALLREHGFRHVRSEVVDLFPHTPHVEVVTRFDR